MEILRFITWFDRESDDFVGEQDIDVKLSDLQNEFNVNKDNPMYDCWEIKRENISFFVKITDVQFDLEKYVYFVEAGASKENNLST